MAKIICSFCNSENEPDSMRCKKCKKRLGHKNLMPLIAVLFILSLLIYPLFSGTGIYINVKRAFYEDVPAYIQKEVDVEKPVTSRVCEDKNYRYSTMSGNVENTKEGVVPNLVLNNLEDRSGYYQVNFSYVSEKKFPYAIYGGENLKKSIDLGNLSYEDADFHSENYFFYIDALESVFIRNSTSGTATGAVYWAIADIVEPKFRYCYDSTEYLNVTENRTFTQYHKEKTVKYVKEYRKLNEILNIHNYAEWVVIVILLFIIIVLLIKIINRER